MAEIPAAAPQLFFDLSDRAKFRVRGGDRSRFLNGQITNDLRKATETEAIEACVLNAKGRIDAHVFITSEPDAYLLEPIAIYENRCRLASIVISSRTMFRGGSDRQVVALSPSCQ